MASCSVFGALAASISEYYTKRTCVSSRFLPKLGSYRLTFHYLNLAELWMLRMTPTDRVSVAETPACVLRRVYIRQLLSRRFG